MSGFHFHLANDDDEMLETQVLGEEFETLADALAGLDSRPNTSHGSDGGPIPPPVGTRVFDKQAVEDEPVSPGKVQEGVRME